jgi:predicted transposase YbfD/YdcC
MEVKAMGRITEAQRIEQGNEEVALEFFKRGLLLLPDPRRRQGVRYPLVSVITVALMAMVCGCDDAEAMEVWGEANAEWLKGLVDLPHGVPTQDVFLAVFGALDPEAFSTVFRAWIDLLRVRARASGRHLAIDGKTSRRSFDTARDRPAIHTASAWLSEEGIVLGQKKTADKSNEITAIPELLRTIDLRGTTVTIDAMGCQTEIAKTIVDGGGQYLLAVKENQPSLLKDVVATFAEAADERRRSVDECARPVVEIFDESDKGHGRVETRSIALCRDLGWMTRSERWTGLSFVAKVTRQRTQVSTGASSTETAYYIGSDAHVDAPGTAAWIRRHGSIENELHWVLDMAFREDEARHRARHVAQNLTTLRHFALNLLKRDPDRKLGVANSRKRAGWDHDYLLRLFTSEGA